MTLVQTVKTTGYFYLVDIIKEKMNVQILLKHSGRFKLEDNTIVAHIYGLKYHKTVWNALQDENLIKGHKKQTARLGKKR